MIQNVIDLKVRKFLLKAEAGCNASQYYFYKLSKGKNEFEILGVNFLQKLLLQMPPHEVKKIIDSIDGTSLTKTDFEYEYTYMLILVAAYALDCGNFATGVYWAKKALDMADYFHPFIDKETRNQILEGENYVWAKEIFEEYNDYFNYKIFNGNGIPFPWEENRYSNFFSSNDNQKDLTL